MHGSARNTYLEAQVLTASPQRLRLMLLDGAVRFTRQLQQARAADQLGEAVLAGDRARQIVAELLSSVKRDGTELTERVIQLYTFLYQRLASAPLHSPEAIGEILELLEYERETWRQVCDTGATELRTGMPVGETTGTAAGSLVLDA